MLADAESRMLSGLGVALCAVLATPRIHTGEAAPVWPLAEVRVRRRRVRHPPAPGGGAEKAQLVSDTATQWWRNARMIGSAMTLDVHHSWRPSTSENNFLSRNLAEPVADARLCCARAPAHRHAAPRRPRSELLTWQRLRCPKGSCIGKRGEGRWWVRSPANSRTSFSKGQKDYRKIGTDFR